MLPILHLAWALFRNMPEIVEEKGRVEGGRYLGDYVFRWTAEQYLERSFCFGERPESQREECSRTVYVACRSESGWRACWMGKLGGKALTYSDTIGRDSWRAK